MSKPMATPKDSAQGGGVGPLEIAIAMMIMGAVAYLFAIVFLSAGG